MAKVRSCAQVTDDASVMDLWMASKVVDEVLMDDAAMLSGAMVDEGAVGDSLDEVMAVAGGVRLASGFHLSVEAAVVVAYLVALGQHLFASFEVVAVPARHASWAAGAHY